jgi:transglutaminase-like putative cysteine protease
MRFPSRKKIARAAGTAAILAIRLALYLTAVVGPIFAFARLLNAEGPVEALLVWAGLCATGILLLTRKGKSKAGRIAMIIGIALFPVIGTIGIFAILVQIAVTGKSLAQAWLELARQGDAFGFFSFFAAEVYAIFSLATGFFLARKRYIGAITLFLAASVLSAGIILGNTALIAGAAALAFLLVAVSGAEEPGVPGFAGRLIAHARASLFPLALAIVLALVTLGISENSTGILPEIAPPDFTSLVAKIAPALPLLRTVPGYGTSIDGGDMPNAVVLSDRKIFRVRGTPNTDEYLASSKYSRWDGASWVDDSDPGKELAFAKAPLFGKKGDIEIELLEDFYPVIPLPENAVSFTVESGLPGTARKEAKITATLNRGIRFSPSARHGLKIELGVDKIAGAASAETSTPAPYDAEESDITPRVAALAARIREASRNGSPESSGKLENEAYLTAVLEYLDRNYIYSLDTGRNVPGDNIDYFLFTGKKGFCLYFAGAFVLLAKAEGIPARLVEGYRVRLDDKGEGTVTGNHAHAWAEVLLGGKWQRYDPTPVYRFDNPYDGIDPRDRYARRQLGAIFGIQDETDENASSGFSLGETLKSPTTGIAALAGAGLALAALAAYALLRLLESDNKKTVRRARRLVKKCAKRGLAGPETHGWKEWARRAEKTLPQKERPGHIAERMMEIAFGKSR